MAVALLYAWARRALNHPYQWFSARAVIGEVLGEKGVHARAAVGLDGGGRVILRRCLFLTL